MLMFLKADWSDNDAEMTYAAKGWLQWITCWICLKFTKKDASWPGKNIIFKWEEGEGILLTAGYRP